MFVASHATERASMKEASIIGLDLAKRSFQAHGALADGSVAFRKKLTREKVLGFLAEQPRCVVAMEACGSAHHWGRAIRDAGHEVSLDPARVRQAVGQTPEERRGGRGSDCGSGEPTDHALRCCQDGGTTGARHAVPDTGSPGPPAHAADQCAARSTIRTWRRGAARASERGDSRSGDRRYDAFTPPARGRIGARIPRSDRWAFGESHGAREGDSVRSQAGRHNPSPADNAGRWANYSHGDRDVRAANGGIPPRARFRSLAWTGPFTTLDGGKQVLGKTSKMGQ